MLKIREAKTILRGTGYVERPGKGSHRIWTHPALPDHRLVLCGHDNEDLLRYQETRLRKQMNALRDRRAS
jgi:predicted RNA binding protein YcfA (HicA-like mRNA interferase family)